MNGSAKTPMLSPTRSWILYDWANSAFATTVMAGFFPLFFKAYYSAGTDPTVSTAQLGLANSVGSFLIALSAPVLGAIADVGGYKKKLLFGFTLLGSATTAALAYVGQGEWAHAALLYALATLGFGGAISFYDSMLPLVSTRENVDRVSSLGYAFGYLGGGLLFLVNVLMYQKPEWFGLADGAAAIQTSFLSVGVWWIVFSIPLLLWVREPRPATRPPLGTTIRQGWKEFIATCAHLRKLKPVLFFLLAFFLYNDGVGTTIKMAVDYGVSIGLPAGHLIAALLLVQFVGFPCAYLFARWSHRFHPRQGIYFSILIYCVTVTWAARMQEVWEFFVLAFLIGTVQGGIQALSRSYFSRLIPAEKSGEFYGFYNLLGKFSGLIGPLLMGLSGVVTGSSRAGILSLLLLFVGGALVLRRVPSDSNV